MEKVSILHWITAAKNASPFDVNMAYDAGFEKIMPYTNVEMNEVMGLVQDAIFSRGPSGVKRESVFIGGRDIDVAMDMLEIARKSMVPPFEVSVFADPSDRNIGDVQVKVDSYNARYGVSIVAVDGANDDLKVDVLKNTDIALCAAAAGVQVLSLSQMAQAPDLKIVADVNAVPPTGAEGVDVFADGGFRFSCFSSDA